MNYSDRELLAKTIQAEAGNQGAQGMMAVGNVIMNRLGKGGSLPDVILAPGQFSPWNSVTGYAGGAQGVDMSKVRPSEQAYKAADLLLSGNYEDITGGATHFYNPSISNPAWGRDKAGGDWQTIGSHIFGKAGGYRTGKGRTMEPTQQKRTGLGGLLGLMGQGDEDTGLTPFQRFAAALDPLIMPEMRGGAAIREMGKARVAKAQQNKTIEWLRSRNREDLAEAVLTGAIDPASAINVALTKPKDDRTALMKEYEMAQKDPKFAELLGLKNAPESPEGLKTLDTEFAKSLGEGGGAQNVSAALQDLAAVQTVLDKLEAGEPLTGPIIGSLPESVRAFISPEGVQAQQLVESVVQKNLRAILGGQFAQKEGEQLVKRAYNPQLPPEQNAARLRALGETLRAAAENKLAMTEYFFDPANNYSLRGYSGPVGVPSLSTFMSALDAEVPKKQEKSQSPSWENVSVGEIVTDVDGKKYKFIGGNRKNPEAWMEVQ